jgi:hypothetical protein
VRKLVLAAVPPSHASCPLCRREIPRGAAASPAASAAGLVRALSVRFFANPEEQRNPRRDTDASPLLAQRARGATPAAAGALPSRERSMRRLAMAAVPGRGAAADREREQFIRRVAEEEERAPSEQSARWCISLTLLSALIVIVVILKTV